VRTYDVKDALKLFPAPKFRKYQKETIVKMVEGLNSGVRCFLLDAPTGFGKSVVNVTFCRLLGSSFYTTPQLSLIDQLRRDRYIGKYLTEIKGRRNYFCVYDPVATCDIGLCYRQKGFDCDKVSVCPYWKAKIRALNARTALMSFAYFILEGRTEGSSPYAFGSRNLLVLDEAHSIDKYIVSHVELRISPWNLPARVYEAVAHKIENYTNLEDVKNLVASAVEVASAQNYDYEILTLDGKTLTVEQARDKQKTEDFLTQAEIFLNTCEEVEWIWDVKYTTPKWRGLSKVFIAQPVYAYPFAEDLIWSRAYYYLVSSATILDAKRFVKENGLNRVLSGDEIMHLKVPSTFPVENRPIINAVNGKMTYDRREKNLPLAVKILEKILDIEEGNNVAVHVHSYDMAVSIVNLLDPKYKSRLITHTPEDRNEALKRFEKSKGKVFICVAFEEGYDWVGDICRAQVLFKVPYPDISDKRVARRLEKHDWKWYRLEALKTVIQAYGRAVRSPDDWARFYVIDLSFVDLLKYEKKYLPKWFIEALPPEWKKLVE